MNYTDYSQTFGSFVRNSDYPLEAEYIFSSVENLQQWCEENQRFLHDGLLKIVKEEENQILYWCYNKTFYPLCDLSTFENLEKLQEFIGQAENITDWIKHVEKHLREGLHDLSKELDITQLSIGLELNGQFNPLSMHDTNYLVGATSIIACLKRLDEEISSKITSNYTLKYENDKILLFNEDEQVSEIDASNFIKDGMIESVKIVEDNLQITWNTDSGKEITNIPLSDLVDLTEIETKINNLSTSLTQLNDHVNGAVFVHYTDTDTLNTESNFRTQLDNRYATSDSLNGLAQESWVEQKIKDAQLTGEDGSDGKDGIDGKTWKPSVNESGELSWTIDSSETAPETVNIKGPKGDDGETGPKGDKPTLEIGSVTSASEASASITEGTEADYALNLVIPSGEVDLTDYYTKEEIDNTLSKPRISINGYHNNSNSGNSYPFFNSSSPGLSLSFSKDFDVKSSGNSTQISLNTDTDTTLPDYIEADKLKTPVKIFGEEFDGSKDIGNTRIQLSNGFNWDTVLQRYNNNSIILGSNYSTFQNLYIRTENGYIEIDDENGIILNPSNHYQDAQVKVNGSLKVTDNITAPNISTIESKLEGVTKAADDSKVIKSFHVMDKDGDFDDNLYPEEVGLGEGGAVNFSYRDGFVLTNNDKHSLNISIDTNYLATRDYVNDIKDQAEQTKNKLPYYLPETVVDKATLTEEEYAEIKQAVADKRIIIWKYNGMNIVLDYCLDYNPESPHSWINLGGTPSGRSYLIEISNNLTVSVSINYMVSSLKSDNTDIDTFITKLNTIEEGAQKNISAFDTIGTDDGEVTKASENPSIVFTGNQGISTSKTQSCIMFNIDPETFPAEYKKGEDNGITPLIDGKIPENHMPEKVSKLIENSESTIDLHCSSTSLDIQGTITEEDAEKLRTTDVKYVTLSGAGWDPFSLQGSISTIASIARVSKDNPNLIINPISIMFVDAEAKIRKIKINVYTKTWQSIDN